MYERIFCDLPDLILVATWIKDSLRLPVKAGVIFCDNFTNALNCLSVNQIQKQASMEKHPGRSTPRPVNWAWSVSVMETRQPANVFKIQIGKKRIINSPVNEAGKNHLNSCSNFLSSAGPINFLWSVFRINQKVCGITLYLELLCNSIAQNLQVAYMRPGKSVVVDGFLTSRPYDRACRATHQHGEILSLNLL